MSAYLHELLEGWVNDAPELRLAGINLDHRGIGAGEAYVAVKGREGHGLDHARAAVDAGAVAVIHDGRRTLPRLDVPAVKIDGLGYKLGELASRYYAAPSELMTIAGVTGSPGKTPVAHYLAQSWQRVYGNAGVVGTPGDGPVGISPNGERMAPDAIRLQQVLSDRAAAGVERLALEISSSALRQSQLETVQFDAAIFTGSGSRQPDGHIDVRRRIFTEYAPSFAVIDRDDRLGGRWFRELSGGMQMLSYGLEKGAELRAEIQNTYTNGTSFRIDGPWGSERVHTGLRGEANLRFLLATAGTLALLGMPWHRVLHQLEVMEPQPGRSQEAGRSDIDAGRAQRPDILEVAA